MSQMNHAENILEEFARHLAEQQSQMREADALMYYAHSRTGLLARFLQRMADRIDPTGEARRTQR
ncbi:MAG TPA: hypothetical protein VGS16_08970 [Candidatus Dormibacteraeota bacterium]|nr:hypothetical protein [Candidatus Dormibacteraeota bacterium]